MIELVPMTAEVFEKFKKASQLEYARALSKVENVDLKEGLKNVAEEFDRLVPEALNTKDQYFFEVLSSESGKSIGYLWLGAQFRFGRKVASINDININKSHRGKGFGKALMKAAEHKAKNFGAERIRLHVFQHNEIARELYKGTGFQVSSVDMFKIL